MTHTEIFSRAGTLTCKKLDLVVCLLENCSLLRHSEHYELRHAWIMYESKA